MPILDAARTGRARPFLGKTEGVVAPRHQLSAQAPRRFSRYLENVAGECRPGRCGLALRLFRQH